MNFLEAVKAMKQGKRVTRKVNEFGDKVTIVAENTMEGPRLVVEDVNWLGTDDIEATDWEVVDDDKD